MHPSLLTVRNCAIGIVTAAVLALPSAALADDTGRIEPAEASASLNDAAPAVLAPSELTPFGDLTLDPSLQSAGSALEVTGSAGDGSIAKDPADGFSLDTGSGTLTVTPIGIDAHASDATVVAGDAALYTNTQQSADTVVRPEPFGIETFTQIRGSDAPEQYSWTVGLGSNEHLVMLDTGGAAVVDEDGDALTIISPPWAKDANGTAVPTTFTVDGTVLTLTVSHRNGSYIYPVVADPHWGWVHIHRTYSYSGARKLGRLLRDGGSIAAAFVAAGAALGGPAGAAVIGIIGSTGEIIIGNRILDANAESHGDGVTIDAGFRCRSVPYLPDPCWPAIWIHPR